MARDPRPIVLWAVPRSASTAFERCFQQHPDVDVVHEPFTDCYYFGPERRSTRYGDPPADSQPRFLRPAHVMASLCPVEGRTIFVKELAFQGEPFVSDQFLGQVRNAFIIRSPLRVLWSLTPLKPDHTADEFGFEAIGRLWQRVEKVVGDVPPVVEGDVFRAAPEAVLRAFCRRIGQPFTSAMLRWPQGSIRAWLPHEAESQAKWHRTLERSIGVLPPGPAVPECAAVAAIAAKEAGQVMRHAWSIYERLLALSVR